MRLSLSIITQRTTLSQDAFDRRRGPVESEMALLGAFESLPSKQSGRPLRGKGRTRRLGRELRPVLHLVRTLTLFVLQREDKRDFITFGVPLPSKICRLKYGGPVPLLSRMGPQEWNSRTGLASSLSNPKPPCIDQATFENDQVNESSQHNQISIRILPIWLTCTIIHE